MKLWAAGIPALVVIGVAAGALWGLGSQPHAAAIAPTHTAAAAPTSAPSATPTGAPAMAYLVEHDGASWSVHELGPKASIGPTLRDFHTERAALDYAGALPSEFGVRVAP